MRNVRDIPASRVRSSRWSMVGYNFVCNKLGMNCAFEIHGATSKDEVMQEAGDHARYAHQINSVPPDLAARINNVITT